MRKLLLLWIISISLNTTAQDYSYRFSGNLTEANQQELLKKLDAFQFFTETKLRYKNDIQKGEVFFSVPLKEVATEEEPPYSILDIKQLLLSFGLVPDTFVERSKK